MENNDSIQIIILKGASIGVSLMTQYFAVVFGTGILFDNRTPSNLEFLFGFER